MKKLFLLFLATAAMTLVSCGGSSSEESSGSSSSMNDSTQMNVPFTTPQSSTETPSSAAAPDVQKPANDPATCSKCGGSGKVKCSKCGGKGYIHKRLRGDDGDWSKDYGCSKCGGSGYRSSEGYDGEHLRKGSGKMKCPECGGSGQK